ncbi:MAG: DUF4214 domain-containing protein [Acetobacteraceae bacterium]|nr:DUF4214 domain-containing protein [Acetobacteraceae bacterium]
MCVLCARQGLFVEAVPAAAGLVAGAPSPTANALLAGAAPGWNGTNGAPAVLNYSFALNPEGGTGAGSFLPFTAQQQAAAREALGLWAAASGLVFVEVPDRPNGQGIDIRFQRDAVAGGFAGTGGYPQDGTITLSSTIYATDPLSRGTGGFVVLLHEIGHTLGLKHPFEASGGNPATLPTAQDNWNNTVMSYTMPWPPPSDIGPYDREAVQFLYGAQAQEPAWVRDARHDPATNATLLPGDDTAEVIWGSARSNAVQAGGGDDRVTLGTTFGFNGDNWVWLGAGNDTVTQTGTGSSRVWGGAGNDAIALGTSFAGNAASFAWGEAGNDVLRGGTGNDLLSGGAGTNSLDGSFGVDIAVFEAARRSVTLTRSVEFFTTVNGDRVNAFRGTATSALETTTFQGVENFGFLDGRLVFAVLDPLMQAYRLYQAVLGRGPDPLGLNGWAAAIQGGMTVAQAAGGFVGSPEFAARFGSPDNGGFVTITYRNVLARDPDPGGYANWLAALNGGLSRAEMIAGFSESAEFKARIAAQLPNGLWDQDETAAAVARLYQATLGRRPEEAGLRGWKQLLDGGAALRDIAPGFIGSPEYAARFGNPDHPGFVTLLYQNVLGRAPDPGGLDGWVGALASGQLDRTGVVLGFSESQEFRGATQSWIEGGIVFA